VNYLAFLLFQLW